MIVEIEHTISNIAISKAQREVEKTPSEPFLPPKAGGSYEVDQSVIAAFPIPGTEVVRALNYGESLWGKTAKVLVRLPSRETQYYFLKVVSLGETGRHMCEGEYESLKAIHALSPSFVPKPYAWGKYEQAEHETYFLLAEFRDVGEQAWSFLSFNFQAISHKSCSAQLPADPIKLAAGLADLHQRSVSPTGKFGFHMATCHARIAQAVNTWEDSWCVLFRRHLSHVMELAKPILKWPEFDVVCKLTLEKVVPRLLLPLQSDGRTLKPCLVHGDCWDGNTAMDAKTGEAFVFDVCSFYGHNEYDTGNWRAPRHRLSNKAYIRSYKKHFPVSEPVEDWDARNLLYSLTFNIGNTIYIPGSQQRQIVYDDMTTLCKMFCPQEYKAEMMKVVQDTMTGATEEKGKHEITLDKEEEEEEEPL